VSFGQWGDAQPGDLKGKRLETHRVAFKEKKKNPGGVRGGTVFYVLRCCEGETVA